MKKLGTLISAVVLGVALTACGTANVDDRTGINDRTGIYDVNQRGIYNYDANRGIYDRGVYDRGIYNRGILDRPDYPIMDRTPLRTVPRVTDRDAGY